MWIRTRAAVWLSLFAGVAFHGAYAESPKSAPAIHWQSDLEQAHHISVEQNRPMLLVFRADSCHWCRRMESRTLADAELVRDVNERFIPLKLDIERHRKIADILGVERIPCTVVLSPRADLLCRMAGLMQLEQYRGTLTQAGRLQRRLEQRQSQTAVSQSVSERTQTAPEPAAEPADQAVPRPDA